MITQYLSVWKTAKIGKFVELFDGQLSREQVKFIIYKLSNPESGFLEFKGTGSGREYFISKQAETGGKLLQRAIQLGLEEMKKSGELKTQQNPQNVDKNVDKNISNNE